MILISNKSIVQNYHFFECCKAFSFLYGKIPFCEIQDEKTYNCYVTHGR